MALPDSGDGPTRRDFEHLAAAVGKLTATIENLPTLMATIYLRQDVYRADQEVHKQKHESQDDEIEDLNSFREWAVRLVVGAVILGLLGMLWAQGG